jgi:hypothetical protein
MTYDPLHAVTFQSMEDNDKKALTEEQQAWLNKAKVGVDVLHVSIDYYARKKGTSCRSEPE